MTASLKKSVLYTYGIADLFFGLLIAMEIYFLPIFLTDYARLPLIIVSQILLFTGIIDIVCTLSSGILLQKVTLRLGGKYRSWFLVGPAIAAPFFVLEFTRIGPDWMAALIIAFGFIASHLLFNVFYSASGAMVGRLSRIPEEVTRLSASKSQGISASGIIFSLTGLPMILFFGKFTDEVTGHAIAVGIYAVLLILGYWYLYWITAGRDPYDEASAGSTGDTVKPSLAEIVSLIWRNTPLIFLIIAEIFRNTYVFIITGFAAHYFKYVMNAAEFVPVFILSISIASLAGSLAAAWIGTKIGKRNSYWIFLLLAAAGFASGRYLPEIPWVIAAVCCIASFFAMVAGSMNIALFSDTVVYGEWKSGRDIRAFIMAVANVPIKVGVFLRSAVLSIGLMAIGFVANTDPLPEVADGLRAIMLFVPAIACALAAGIFYFGYKLEDGQIRRMQEEIGTRRRRP